MLGSFSLIGFFLVTLMGQLAARRYIPARWASERQPAGRAGAGGLPHQRVAGLLFGAAFVLTRPFGATLDDLLTKFPEKHSLGFGIPGSSLILFGLLAVLVVYASVQHKPVALPNTSSEEDSHRTPVIQRVAA